MGFSQAKASRLKGRDDVDSYGTLARGPCDEMTSTFCCDRRSSHGRSHMKMIRDGLTRLEYEPVEGALFYQFAKPPGRFPSDCEATRSIRSSVRTGKVFAFVGTTNSRVERRTKNRSP